MPEGLSHNNEEIVNTKETEGNEDYQVFSKIEEYVDRHKEDCNPSMVEERVNKLLEAAKIYNA